VEAIRTGPSRLARSISRWRIWLLAFGLTVATMVVLAVRGAAEQNPLHTLGVVVPAVALLYFCAERFPVHLVIRRETHTFSLSEIPLIIGLFFMPPGEIIVAQAVGAGLALAWHRRQRSAKLAFNLANFAFATAVAAVVFHGVLRSEDALGPWGWVAAFIAAMVTDQLGGVGVALAIWLSTGARPEADPRGAFSVPMLYSFVDASLALVAVIVLSVRPESSWLLAVIAVTTLVGFRLYQSERVKRENLGSLQESTRQLQETLEGGDLTRLLLGQVREMFNARIAELHVFPGGALPAASTRLGPDGDLTVEQVASDDPGLGIEALVAERPTGFLLAPHAQDERAKRWLAGRGLVDAMIAPVRDGETVRAILVAGDRMGNVATFSTEHLTLLETLANHAAVAFKNGYLVDQLRAEADLNDYQARHDPLTDLPNRRLFRERLTEALDSRTSTCAVLLLDVDRFKEVNDTLGHHNGDLVLREMAVRLAESVGRLGLVARFSGDEFAALLVQPASDPASIEDRAVAAAGAIGAAFATPFHVEGLALGFTASIGISLAPEHGSSVDALIRRADVAMYQAKGERTGFMVYRLDRDEFSAARLALVNDLREAIERGKLEVVYQMKVDAAGGRVEGAEALVRWRHPVRGMISPEEFVGLAEHAGLIRGLTEHVLRTAARDAAVWRGRWPDLRVAVNMSPRTLLDSTLPPLIRGILLEHGLPPSALTLEVTESAIVGDDARVASAFRDYNALGCRISIDDFGTGYSSFSYLRRLPINEIKVDRSFVSGMTTDAQDRTIVEVTIDLGHRLGKRIVAEGVETEAIADRLRALGCDTLQGYLISRPISHEAFMEAVEVRKQAERRPRRRAPRRVERGALVVVPGGRLRSKIS
jgi:diguanylate cyclase (GGDEF)-like protein